MRDAILQRDTFDRDERDHVGRAHARMRAGMLGEVNQLGGLADAADGSLGNVRRIADQGDDAAIMVGVHLAVEQINAVHLHGFQDGVDAGLVAAFREVGNTFDECGHKV